MRVAKTGVLYETAVFKIGAGITGRAGSLTTTLLFNKTPSLVSVTMTEVGGLYYGSLTPDADGLWELVVVDPLFAVAGFREAFRSVAQPIVTAQDLIDAIADGWSADGQTLRKALRVLLSDAGGKSNGFDTLTPKFRNLGDTKDVISGTIDAFGNRTATTIDSSP